MEFCNLHRKIKNLTKSTKVHFYGNHEPVQRHEMGRPIPIFMPEQQKTGATPRFFGYSTRYKTACAVINQYLSEENEVPNELV